MAKCFVSRGYMLQIVIRSVTISFLILKCALIPRSLLFSAAILTLSLTAFLTELARILPTLSVRALLRFRAFSRLVAFLISGATCTRPRIVSLGLRLLLPVIFFPFLSLITVLFVFLFLSLMQLPSGPGLWKLNLSVLDDPEYVSLITGFWSFWPTRIFSFPSLDV